jgi:hypothetical protein
MLIFSIMTKKNKYEWGQFKYLLSIRTSCGSKDLGIMNTVKRADPDVKSRCQAVPEILIVEILGCATIAGNRGKFQGRKTAMAAPSFSLYLLVENRAPPSQFCAVGIISYPRQWHLSLKLQQ